MAITPSQLEEDSRKQQRRAAPAKPALKGEEEREVLAEEEAYRKGLVSIRDLLAPSGVKIFPRHLCLGDKYVRTLFLTTFPRYISVGWFAPIINLNVSLDIGMYFYPVEAQVVLKQLKKKVGNVEAEIVAEQEKGMPRDPLKETALRDIEDLRDKLTTGVEHFFQFALYVTIYAKDEKELDLLSERVENLFGSKLVVSRRIFYQAEQGFNSTLPLGNDELMINLNLNSSPSASSFPFISADLTSDNGILYGINRHNNSLILFDRFSMPNANMTVFATSGAGKSLEGSEPVLIRNNEGIRLTEIGSLVEEKINERGAIPLDGEMEGVINPDLEVYTFDNQLTGGWSKVTVAARKKAPQTMYQFKTRSGRSITTTGDHNLLVLRKGKVRTIKSSEVGKGEYIPLVRKVPEAKKPLRYLNLLRILSSSKKIYVDGAQKIIAGHYNQLKQAKLNPNLDKYLYKYRQERRIPIHYLSQILNYLHISLDEKLAQRLTLGSAISTEPKTSFPALLKISPAFLRLVGYIVSEGTIGSDFILISQQDLETKKDIERCLEALNVAYYKRDESTFAIASRVFVEIVKALKTGSNSANKRIPFFIFDLARRQMAEFLSAYFEGDGGVDGDQVSAVSKSKNLISDISYLFYYFGIVARLSEVKKKAPGWAKKKTYHSLVISGQQHLKVFAHEINFISTGKKKALSKIINKQANTNVDVIPGVENIFQEIYDLFSFGLYGIKEISAFKNNSYKPSREKLKQVIQEIKTRIERFKGLRGKFEILKRLPSLSSVVSLGANNKELNSKLWQELGQSWRLMKNEQVKPGLVNVLKAMKIVGFTPCPTIVGIKNNIYSGFREMGLSMKDYNTSLGDALAVYPESSTTYETIWQTAQFVWRQYQLMLDKISQVEEKLTQLEAFAYSNLFWDPVAKVKKIKNDQDYVYDLTVDNEVFLAGQGGMFVHNSYAIKLEVLRSLMIGTDVIIIDPEREYKHLSDAVGGTYINVSLTSKAKINPFDLPRSMEEKINTGDLIRSSVITLKGLLKIMIGQIGETGQPEFTPQEDSLLDRALLETYAKKDIVPGCDLNRVEMPTMSDLQEILEGMQGATSLAQRLRKYTEGTFAGFLNYPTNVKMDNQLVTFSVRDLEDELKPIAIYTIINYIWNVVRSEMKKRILVIDEAWWLMQQESSAKFIFAMVKRCRKYYLGVTTITQDVNDFLTSDYGRAIVTNSALNLLLRQSTAAIDQITKTFMLTEGEKWLLLQCGVGDGIFFAGEKHAAIKIVASYSEDQLITSDPQELLKIKQAKKEFAQQEAGAAESTQQAPAEEGLEEMDIG